MKIVSTRPQPVSAGWGLSVSASSPTFLSYVNDGGAVIIKDANGAELPDWERRVDRRTACLHQADAFREKALADPEHHDQWIDEAIKWLEQAMEAGRRAAVIVEADVDVVPEPVHTTAIDPLAARRRVIARQ